MFSCAAKVCGSDYPKFIIYKHFKRPLQAHVETHPHPVKAGRKTYKTFLGDKSGSVTVEAALVLPLFILAMLSVFYMGETVIVRNVIYEAFQETAQYMAERSYLYETRDMDIGITTVASNLKIREYIDDQAQIERYVSGGISGIRITKTSLDEDNYIYMELRYSLTVNVPVFGAVCIPCRERICQRAYLGYDPEKDDDSQEAYVYVAENGYVYHTSRSCYHISLSIHQVSEDRLKTTYANLTECSICARSGNTGSIYVTEDGDRYHRSLDCSGLKRTVYRCRKDECAGYVLCSECGKDH